MSTQDFNGQLCKLLLYYTNNIYSGHLLFAKVELNSFLATNTVTLFNAMILSTACWQKFEKDVIIKNYNIL